VHYETPRRASLLSHELVECAATSGHGCGILPRFISGIAAKSWLRENGGGGQAFRKDVIDAQDE